MRNLSDRVWAVEQRTRALRRAREKRRRMLIAGLSTAACLAVILAAARMIPRLAARQCAGISDPDAMASLFAAGSASGYVLIGILAFALGCGVTILCYRLSREKHHGRDHR